VHAIIEALFRALHHVISPCPSSTVGTRASLTVCGSLTQVRILACTALQSSTRGKHLQRGWRVFPHAPVNKGQVALYLDLCTAIKIDEDSYAVNTAM
jgi:hypothetical protein